jgi:DNA/RNA-binding domain of Phe-tRNA-synthetase-like protein
VTESTDLDAYLAGATVDDDVFALRPDYRVLLVAVAGLTPGPGDAASEALLARAETSVAGLADELEHVAAWREAYRAFGAKPTRTRNSLEALVRRAPAGLPRVNRLTDVYNAISVLHRVPVGGEDLDRYDGPPRLVRAQGNEVFDTTADGEPVLEHPEPGEVVWRDGGGVTCRGCNWRQGRRTALTDDTTATIFIFDALAPMTDDALHGAADDLVAHLGAPDARRRLIGR